MSVKLKVLEAIRSNGAHKSGQEISADLKMTRTAIWKYVNKLRREGYKISAKPRLGYKLEKVPDLLLPQEVQKGLVADLFGKEVLHFPKVDSTINVATKLAKSSCADGTVVVAEQQTSGKGRMDRNWVSAKGGIWASIVVFPSFDPTEVIRLNIAITLSLIKAIKESLDIDVKIKWPNDILHGENKIAGVLTKVDSELDKVNYAIISFGVNANNNVNSLIKNNIKAASLKSINGKKVDRIKLLQSILMKFEGYYKDAQTNDFSKSLSEWETYCQTLGQKINVKTVEADYAGTATGIDEHGHLILELGDGQKTTLLSGDIFSD